jgi:hypothetical protein
MTARAHPFVYRRSAAPEPRAILVEAKIRGVGVAFRGEERRATPPCNKIDYIVLAATYTSI